MTAATVGSLCPTAGDSAGSALAYCVSNGTSYTSLIVAPGATGNTSIPGSLTVGTTVPVGAPSNSLAVAGAVYASTAGGYVPTWVKYTIPYTSLTAAGTTQTVTLFTLPAQGKLQGDRKSVGEGKEMD